MSTIFTGERRRRGSAAASSGPKREPAANAPAAPAAPPSNLRRVIRPSSVGSDMLAPSFPSPNPQPPSRSPRRRIGASLSDMFGGVKRDVREQEPDSALDSRQQIKQAMQA